ncbi:MAG: helix-turn-helix domain-containing protein [Ktedonobacteraceae bacterium]
MMSPTPKVARTHNIPASTVRRWVKRYREKGLQGLGQSSHCTSRMRHLSLIAISPGSEPFSALHI